uniref:Histone H2A n=1 Tax=Aegilops tauschii subsp. strangulata TaxID=200361 RepID=A0A453GXM5_AEGTS
PHLERFNFAGEGGEMAGRKSGERKKAVTWCTKAGLQILVDRIGRYLKKGRYTDRVGPGALVYLAAFLEYLAVKVTNQRPILYIHVLFMLNVVVTDLVSVFSLNHRC